MRGLARQGFLLGRASSLPWRNASTTQNTTGGRGRGKKRAAHDIFHKQKSEAKFKNSQELSQLVADWKKQTPRSPKHKNNQQNAADQKIEQGDLSKILGDVINRKPEPALKEIDDAPEASGGGDGNDFDLPLESEMFAFTNKEKHLDLPMSPQELEDELNSVEGMEKFGKILGTQGPPKIRFNLTCDEVPEPDLDEIADLSGANEDGAQDLDLTRADAKTYAERLVYSGTREEDDQLDTLKEFLRNPDSNEKYENSAKLFDSAVRSTDYIMDYNLRMIREHQHQRGFKHGSSIREATQHIGDLYDTYEDDLDKSMDKILRAKMKKDPEFAERHREFTNQWNELMDQRDVAEEKYGDDHEITLGLQNKLHAMAIRHCRNFTIDDYAVGEIPLFETHDDIPGIHSDYLGPDGDAKLQQDFHNKQVKLDSYEEAMKKFPKATNYYFDGMVSGIADNSQERLEKLCFHAAERTGTAHHDIFRKAVFDAVASQRWEKIGTSLSMPLPTNVNDFLLTQVVVVEYQKHINEFRDHLENFIVTKLTEELRLLKEDTADFYEVATRLDKIREDKRKRYEQRAFVLERSKQRAIEAGTFRPPTVSIISRALARKGFVAEEDILDQALEYLRRDGKKFTHKDIPSCRVDNFNQKFRAIYFNGSLKPMDKAKMVADTISNFIISTEEIKVAHGAFAVMSKESTPFEKQEQEKQKNEGDLSVNLDYTTVSVDKKKVRTKLIQKKEGEASWEGYDTSDFEHGDSEEQEEQIPAEFDALSKFKPHAKVYSRWAEVVDQGADRITHVAEEDRAKGDMLFSDEDSETPLWDSEEDETDK